MCTETYGVLLTFCPYLYWQFKILTAESSPEGTRKSTRISHSIIGMKIGPFGSYIKWTGELGSTGCTFIACFFFWFHIWSHKPILFSKLYTLYFPWNLSFFLLAWLCYTADCNVLTLWRSCYSTLPIFIQQTKDGSYLNLNLASRQLCHQNSQQK